MVDEARRGAPRPLAATIGVGLLSACLIADVARSVLMPSALSELTGNELIAVVIFNAFLAALIVLIARGRRWALIVYLAILLLDLPQLWTALHQAGRDFPSVGWPGWDVATLLVAAVGIALLLSPKQRHWFLTRRQLAQPR